MIKVMDLFKLHYYLQKINIVIQNKHYMILIIKYISKKQILMN